MTEQRGACIACAREGRGTQPFLCDDCVNPTGAMLVCRICQRRMRVSLEGLQHLGGVLQMDFPAGPGVVLVSPWYPGCTHAEPLEIETDIYTVRSFMN